MMGKIPCVLGLVLIRVTEFAKSALSTMRITKLNHTPHAKFRIHIREFTTLRLIICVLHCVPCLRIETLRGLSFLCSRNRHSHSFVLQNPTWPIEWQQISVILAYVEMPCHIHSFDKYG